MSLDLDNKRDKWQKGIMVLGVLAIAFFAAPIIFLTIKGLIGLVIALAISYTALQFLPYFGMLVANWRLKAMKAEASSNPIETLENDFMEQVNNLKKYKAELADFSANVAMYEGEYETFKKKYPDNADALVAYQEQIAKLHRIFELRCEKYKAAMHNLDVRKDQIENARGKWEIAQSMARMNKLAGGPDPEQFLKSLMVDTAFSAVDKGLTSSFAELDMAFLDEKDQPKNVTPAAQPVIEMANARSLPAPKSLQGLDLSIDDIKVGQVATVEVGDDNPTPKSKSPKLKKEI